MSTMKSIAFSGHGFPTIEGGRLADKVLMHSDANLAELEIDLTTCKPILLISAFSNAFLQRVYEQQPSKIDEARCVQWRVNFDFQRANIENWMRDFKPVVSVSQLD